MFKNLLIRPNYYVFALVENPSCARPLQKAISVEINEVSTSLHRVFSAVIFFLDLIVLILSVGLPFPRSGQHCVVYYRLSRSRIIVADVDRCSLLLNLLHHLLLLYGLLLHHLLVHHVIQVFKVLEIN